MKSAPSSHQESPTSNPTLARLLIAFLLTAFAPSCSPGEDHLSRKLDELCVAAGYSGLADREEVGRKADEMLRHIVCSDGDCQKTPFTIEPSPSSYTNLQ